jgi:MFS family permease
LRFNLIRIGGLGAGLPVRGRSYEVFNVEIVMLTVLSSLYVLSIMLWYNFLSLYLGSFFEVEEVGLLLSILTAGGTLSIILGGLLADSLGRRRFPANGNTVSGVGPWCGFTCFTHTSWAPVEP